jgi:hypothetical protein
VAPLVSIRAAKCFHSPDRKIFSDKNKSRKLKCFPTEDFSPGGVKSPSDVTGQNIRSPGGSRGEYR